MIKLDKRQIISLFISFFYLLETACPQPVTLAPPSAFEKTGILIVCTGNTCRSPMAGALLTKYLSEIALRQIVITTAGIRATNGVPASTEAIDAVSREGINLTTHQAAYLTRELIDSADIILVMTREQLDIVKAVAPDKVFLFAGDYDIPDPMTGHISYPETVRVIKDNIPRIRLFLAERFPHLRKGLDPEWELWGEAVSLSSGGAYKDRERAIELLSRGWENPFRQNQAIKILVSALKWEGRLKKIAKERLVKIGIAATDALLEALSKEDRRSFYIYEFLEALGDIKDPKAIDPLIELLQKKGFPKTDITHTLYEIGHKSAVEKILDLVVNKGNREKDILDALRWVGRLDLRRVFLAWQKSEGELRAVLFNIILQMPSEAALGPLIIAIRDSEGTIKDELEKKKDSNWYWKEKLNDESRDVLEQLAYYLYDIGRLYIFPDLANFLIEGEYTGLELIKGLITEAKTSGSPQPFLSAIAKAEYKKNAGLLAVLLDKMEYYPEGYTAQILGKETASFLQGLEIGEMISYQELVSSQLFWQRHRPKSVQKAIDGLKRARDILGQDLFASIRRDIGFQALTNKIILEEVVGVELDPRLTILVHPAVIPYLKESIKDAKTGRRLFYLASYTGLAQSGTAQEAFGKFLEWNYRAREAMVETELIDKSALRQIIDAAERMFGYYKQAFSDDRLGEIERKWEEIKRDTLALTDWQGITWLNIVRGVDSIETVHDFINFIHQRGLNKRHGPTRQQTQNGVPGELTTALFTAGGGIIDKTRHTFLIRGKTAGESIYDLPEEVRYVLRNLLFFMNNTYHLPECKIDISGTEITIFLPIGEHSAQLYINLSQPQQGGMIELHWDEGNTEAGNIIRQNLMEGILGKIGFSVSVNNALLKARYDSQSGANTIKDITDRGARILRLVLGTRDLDYLLSSSHISDSADYAGFIHRMGMPVFRKMVETGSMEPWLDALKRSEPDVRRVVNEYLRGLKLEILPEDIPFGPNMINTYLNKQIDRAVERQELIYNDKGEPVRNPDYEELSQVRIFAELLQVSVKRKNLIAMVDLFQEVIRLVPARVVDIGAINGYPVRRVQLEFPGRVLSLWGLYHPAGHILAAYGALGDRLNRLKDPVTGEVRDNVITSPQLMLALLKKQRLSLSNKFLNVSEEDLKIRSKRLDSSMARPQFIPLVNLGAAVRFSGVRVSSGLSTGMAVFNTGHKKPEDFKDAVLLAPYTIPRDVPKMEKSEAVVTTGGGPLTHTGIIARELKKPALIIAGEWEREGDEAVILVEYEIFTRIQEKVGNYTITRRININPKLSVIREGDILTIDGTSGVLYNWGQNKGILEAWGLSKEIQNEKSWKAWERLLAIAKETDDILTARFLIHKIFAGRLSNMLDYKEKLKFVSTLCLNKILGEEGREFLHRLLNAQKDELTALIREYSVRIGASRYPREILQLMKEIKRRQKGLVLFYKVLRLQIPGHLLDEIKILDDLSQRQYQILGSKVISQLGYYMREGMPAKAKEMRHMRNLWQEAEYLSRLTRLDLKKFSNIRNGLRKWEQGRQKRIKHLAAKDTLTLGQIDIYTVSLTGAKAAALGEIARILPKKTVPNGFSITDHAFQRFMEHNRLWQRIEAITASTDTPAEKYRLVQDAFGNAGWPPELEREIMEQYHALEKDLGLEEKWGYIREIINNGLSSESDDVRETITGIFTRDKAEKQNKWARMTISEIINQVEIVTTGIKEKLLKYNEESGGPVVAIRSSSVGSEDSPEASFAGEMETYLYQRGKADILVHAKLCMASLWTPRVISYREWHGYPQTGLHHAVFIQLMVDSEVSAVGFTIDPANMDWNQIVLNSGWGVGEGIMGGRVNTDFYSIDKQAPLGEGVVEDVRRKPAMYAFDRGYGRGVRQIDVPQNRQDMPTLNMKDIERIKQVLIILERYWGIPRDVELAKDRGGNIKIVQDRPVTALNGFGRAHGKNAGETPGFRGAIRRFNVIKRKVSDSISQGKIPELTNADLRIIELVLYRRLKPTTVGESRQLEEKARGAAGLIELLRNNLDKLGGSGAVPLTDGLGETPGTGVVVGRSV